MTRHRSRDSQRSKAYRSEHEWSPSLPAKYRLTLSPVQLEKQARRIHEEEVQSFGFRRTLTIRFSSRFDVNRAEAWSFQNTIKFSRRGASFWVVLHELAHLMEPGHRHDRQWAECYLNLITRHISKKAATDLKRLFRKHGVRYRKPRKLSPLQMAALAKGQAALAARRTQTLTLTEGTRHGNS